MEAQRNNSELILRRCCNGFWTSGRLKESSTNYSRSSSWGFRKGRRATDGMFSLSHHRGEVGEARKHGFGFCGPWQSRRHRSEKVHNGYSDVDGRPRKGSGIGAI